MSLISELKKLKAVKKGKFVLKSGQISDCYIDIKKAFGSPKAFELICNQFCKIIDKRATSIAGSGHGGLPLATAVSLKLGLPLILVRDKVKEHGIPKMIDGHIPSKKDRVVIIDDVFTTGTCISNIVWNLKGTKAKIIAGYVVVNRGEAKKFKLKINSLLTAKQLTK